MRTQRLTDLTRHWHTLLCFAEAEGLPGDRTDSLRRSRTALTAATDSGSVTPMRAALADVRRAGLAVEQLLRDN